MTCAVLRRLEARGAPHTHTHTGGKGKMEASNMDIKTRLEKGKWKLARLLTRLAAHYTAGTTQLARLQYLYTVCILRLFQRESV